MRLGVNIDHIATLRQARRGRRPDPIEAAQVCERAGAHQIVCHVREDRRHIQETDVRRLKRTLRIPLNLEMSIAPEMVRLALAVRPNSATLVPERRQELTTEGGLDVSRLAGRLRRIVPAFAQAGIAVSLFIDPDPRQVRVAHELGVPSIELHTGRYAQANSTRAQARELRVLAQTATLGHQLGLVIAAGHGVDYDNAAPLARIAQIEELNIGFSIVSRAVFVGIDQAVREMLALVRRHGA